jgi:ATP-binding cassette subfamily C protein
MSSSSETSSTLTAVRGNAALLLVDTDIAWKVHSGTVAVFAVRAQDGEPVGPRRFLFSCNQGEWLFGADPSVTADARTFLVVGLEDSELAPVAFRSVLPASGNMPPTTIPKLEAWVRRIGSVIAALGSHAHSEKAHVDGPIALAAAQNIKPQTDHVLWLNVVSGALSLAEVPDFSIDSNRGWIPASGELRLVATQDAEVQFKTSADLEGSHVATGLKTLHRACFDYLHQLDEKQRDLDAQRLAIRQELQEEETSSVLGELGQALLNRRGVKRSEDELMTALSVIGTAMGVVFRRPASIVDKVHERDPIEIISRASRVRSRRVLLRGQWWKKDAGPILGQFGDEGRPVALLPTNSGYVVYDPVSDERLSVDRELDRQLSRDAVTFIRPLPDDATSLLALAKFAIVPIAPDIAFVVFLAAAITVLGMLVPIATGLVIDEAIPDANTGLLYQLAAGLFAMACAQAALSFSQSTILLRSDTGTTARLQSAVIDRLLRIPARFFRTFSSGDLQNRALMITEMSRDISNTAVGGILMGGMAVLNLMLCLYYSPQLALLAVVSALVIAVYTAGLSVFIRGAARKLSIGYGKLFGFQVQLISGISKLRVAGAEQRAFNNWARRMASQIRLMSGIQRMENWGTLVNTGLQHATTILLYYFAAQMLTSSGRSTALASSGPVFLSMGTFLAFYVAFQHTIGGLTGLSSTLVDLGDTWAKRRLVMPLLEERPEDADEKVDPGPLDGALSLSNITFRYREDGPLVLNDVSLQVNAGQFVAIVGPSGCGKSTLLRILLGFETPETGTICYDGQDLAGLDSTAVRRQIGVVLQSGILNSGSLYENIAGAARVSLDETWEAARAAGLGDDIEQMPMGMHTFVNEGGGTLSGGQRQRLLIARALVTKPRIIIFDEATSALDNRTQQIVTESLDRLQVTRIVVAHRLSTIRDANRIYVMQDGKIAQSGAFDELANQEGLFRRMIARQLA